MHSNIRLAAKLLVTPAIIAAVFLLVESGKQPPEITEVSSARSPDGQRVARLVFTVYGGHLTGDPARHEVYIGNFHQAVKDQTLAFAAEGGDYQIEWTGARELRIASSKTARIELQESHARDVSIQYSAW